MPRFGIRIKRKKRNALYGVAVRADEFPEGIDPESVIRVVTQNVERLNSNRSPRVTPVERQRIRENLMKETGVKL